MRQLVNYRRDSLWDFMSEIEKAFETAVPSARQPQSFTPAVDLHETGDLYLVSMDLPGVNEKDIQIDTQPGRLTVRGERSRSQKGESDGFQRFERVYGSFERAFALPQDVNVEGIQARFENGVLEVLIPKKETVQARKIELNKDQSGLFSKLLGKKEAPLPEKH